MSFFTNNKTGETEIAIALGVQSGNSVKIKGAGVPYVTRPSQRGDHIVVISVKIPTKISDEERNLYKKLYEISHGVKQSSSVLEKVKGVFN